MWTCNLAQALVDCELKAKRRSVRLNMDCEDGVVNAKRDNSEQGERANEANKRLLIALSENLITAHKSAGRGGLLREMCYLWRSKNSQPAFASLLIRPS